MSLSVLWYLSGKTQKMPDFPTVLNMSASEVTPLAIANHF